MRALLALVLVGCGGAAGIVVEVDVNGLDVTTVELVIAKQPCHDPIRDTKCQSIQGQGFDEALGAPNDIFAREASAITGTIEDGIARFELPESDEVVPMAFAIGRNATGITGAAAMVGTLDLAAGPIRYRVALSPSEDLRDRTNRMGLAGAAEWGGACLGVEPVRSTLMDQRPLFIVPADDPDCDGRITKDDGECDALWFDGLFYNEGTAQHCVRPSTVLDGAPCVIGHVPQCIEGDVNEVDACVEQPFRCVPDAVCARCPDPAADLGCQNQALSTALDGRFDCVTPGSGQPQAQACVENEFLLLPIVQVPDGGKCTDARFVQTPLTAIDSVLMRRFEIPSATFEVKSVQDDCTILMKWTGDQALATKTRTLIVISYEIDNSAREFWVPISFSPSATCPEPGNTIGCQYLFEGPGEDHLEACLH